MKKFLYIFPTLVTVMYIVFVTICAFYGFNINTGLFIFATLICLIPMIIYVIQVVNAILDSIRNKRFGWTFLLLFLNIIFIPYYANKYILKKIVLRNSIITYVISVIFLGALAALYTFTLIGKNTDMVLKTNDKRCEFDLTTNWKSKTEDGYSLYAENSDKKIAFGVLTYDMSKYETYTVDNILEDQKNYLSIKLDSIELYKSLVTKNINDKTIKTIEYKVKDKNEDKYSIYILSTISFEKDKDYILYVFEKVNESDYSKYNKELKTILEEVRLNN